MKQGLTEMVFILDRSGSMHGLESDTIGGFNSMIYKQKRMDGEAVVSTVLFNSLRTVVHDRVPLDRISDMTANDYVVGGCTALLDAVGHAIHHIGNVHKYAREEDVPEKTMFVIITDGLENASREYSAQRVKDMITRQKEKHGWEFLFLGANIDAEDTAERYGIDRSRAVTYRADAIGTEKNFRAVSEAICSMRCGAPLATEWKREIEQDVRKRGR